MALNSPGTGAEIFLHQPLWLILPIFRGVYFAFRISLPWLHLLFPEGSSSHLLHYRSVWIKQIPSGSASLFCKRQSGGTKVNIITWPWKTPDYGWHLKLFHVHQDWLVPFCSLTDQAQGCAGKWECCPTLHSVLLILGIICCMSQSSSHWSEGVGSAVQWESGVHHAQGSGFNLEHKWTNENEEVQSRNLLLLVVVGLERQTRAAIKQAISKPAGPDVSSTKRLFSYLFPLGSVYLGYT